MPLRRDCCRQDLFHVDPLRGIVAGVAGGAVADFLLVLQDLQQPVERQIGQRVGLDVLANLFDGVVGGDEVASCWACRRRRSRAKWWAGN